MQCASAKINLNAKFGGRSLICCWVIVRIRGHSEPTAVPSSDSFVRRWKIRIVSLSYRLPAFVTALRCGKEHPTPMSRMGAILPYSPCPRLACKRSGSVSRIALNCVLCPWRWIRLIGWDFFTFLMCLWPSLSNPDSEYDMDLMTSLPLLLGVIRRTGKQTDWCFVYI